MSHLALLPVVGKHRDHTCWIDLSTVAGCLDGFSRLGVVPACVSIEPGQGFEPLRTDPLGAVPVGVRFPNTGGKSFRFLFRFNYVSLPLMQTQIW